MSYNVLNFRGRQQPEVRVRRNLLMDYEGVLAPVCEELRVGAKITSNRLSFLSEKTGMPEDKVREYARSLRREHGTDSYEFIIQRLGIKLEEYVKRVYGPHIGEFRDEMRRDGELIGLMRRIQGKKAVLSNTVTLYVNTGLEAQGLNGFFDAVLAAENMGGLAKPHKEAYAKALQITGFNPEDTVYFEDRTANLKAAHGLGMTTVYIGRQGMETHREYVRYSFKSLNDALKSLFAEDLDR